MSSRAAGEAKREEPLQLSLTIQEISRWEDILEWLKRRDCKVVQVHKSANLLSGQTLRPRSLIVAGSESTPPMAKQVRVQSLGTGGGVDMDKATTA